MKPDGYIVLCLGDDDTYHVLATRTVFPTEEEADKYAEAISADRKPITAAWEARRFSMLDYPKMATDEGRQLREKWEESLRKPIPPEVIVDRFGKEMTVGSPEFWAMIEESRRQPTRPLADIMREIDEEERLLWKYLGICGPPAGWGDAPDAPDETKGTH
jgi:hypothetical protein